MGTSWQSLWENRKASPSRTAGNIEQRIQFALRADGFDNLTGIGLNQDNLKVYVSRWVKSVGVQTGDRIHEIGCGSGAFLASISGLLDVHLEGSDISPELIQLGKSLFPGIDFELCSALDLSLDKKINHLVSFSVFFYFPNLDYSLKVVQKMQKSGARTISILDIPDLEWEESVESSRAEIYGPENYQVNYLDKGLKHLYYDKNWWHEIFGESWQVTIRENQIGEYSNNKHRYDVIAKQKATKNRPETS